MAKQTLKSALETVERVQVKSVGKGEQDQENVDLNKARKGAAHFVVESQSYAEDNEGFTRCSIIKARNTLVKPTAKGKGKQKTAAEKYAAAEGKLAGLTPKQLLKLRAKIDELIG